LAGSPKKVPLAAAPKRFKVLTRGCGKPVACIIATLGHYYVQSKITLTSLEVYTSNQYRIKLSGTG